MPDDAQTLMAALERVLLIYGNKRVLWQDPETGALYPVQVHEQITAGPEKAEVYFALVPQRAPVAPGAPWS